MPVVLLEVKACGRNGHQHRNSLVRARPDDFTPLVARRDGFLAGRVGLGLVEVVHV